jgi:hypothetical protein
MTVATQSILVTYLGDDVATVFPFTFPVYDADHLSVYLQDTTTRLLVLLSASDYSVTGIGNENGGSVVTDDPVASNNNILIARVLPFTQDLDVLNQGGFYPENVENEFDLTQMQVQQVNQEVNRSVRGPLDNEWPELPTAPIRRAQLLGFTDDTNAYPTVDTFDIFFNMLASILQAGFGIEITIGDGIITITNTAPGSGELQACWLLEDATSGGGGGAAGDAEFVRDTIGTALQGLGCVITVDDGTNTITVDCTTDTTGEVIRDFMGTALVAGSGITITPSDPGNTITISSDLSGVAEIARDAVGTALVGGVGIAVTVSDGSDTITLDTVPDIQSVVSAATVTPTFANNQVNITAQAAGLTLANPTGTAVDGHGIMIRIKDNGTARAIAYGTQYRAFNDALPATTTISKTLYIGMVYNAADTKWDVLGVRQEA